MRNDRKNLDLRKIEIITDFIKNADASCLIKSGDTHVVCTASIEDKVPRWLKGSGKGWVTAEYGMLPRSTHERMRREASSGKIGGRTSEIQRLIGRSLRAAINPQLLGEYLITIDCDVLQADGGTRTASITGAFVALSDAIDSLLASRKLKKNPIHGSIASVSVGIFEGLPVVDLDYAEDSNAETDMNVVMNDAGHFVEVQGTAEGHAFRRDEMDAMLDLAASGIKDLLELQAASRR